MSRLLQSAGESSHEEADYFLMCQPAAGFCSSMERKVCKADLTDGAARQPHFMSYSLAVIGPLRLLAQIA